MSPQDLAAQKIRELISLGLVIHINPDFLLAKYGPCFTGQGPVGLIGSRYALCVGMRGTTTFWVLLSSQCHPYSVLVPLSTKSGAWSRGSKPTPSFFSPTQIWVVTKEMILEAHFQGNPTGSTLLVNRVDPHKFTQWPVVPEEYPRFFVPLSSVAISPAPVVKAQVGLTPTGRPAIDPWRVWVRTVRVQRSATLRDVADAMAVGMGACTLVGLEKGYQGRLFRQEELDAWARVLKVEGDPALKTIPIAKGRPKRDAWRVWVQKMRVSRGMRLRSVTKLMGLEYFHTGSLSLIENGSHARLFSSEELDAWAKAVGVQGDPMLEKLPLATPKMLHRRQLFNAKVLQPTPQPTPKAISMGPHLPQTNPIALVRVAPVNRQALVNRITKLLNNHRLTDTEAQDIVNGLEAQVIATLLEA